MSHRTQITLTDGQYERLVRESDRSGVGLAELVRRAVNHTYGSISSDDRIAGLEASRGSWANRDEDGAAQVERLRRGLARRLANS